MQGIWSALISPSLLEQESFLKMGIKQNANNLCYSSLLDVQWMNEGKGKVSKHGEQGTGESVSQGKMKQGNEPELGRTTKMASSLSYIPTALDTLTHLSLDKQQLAACHLPSLIPWNAHAGGEDRRLLRGCR